MRIVSIRNEKYVRLHRNMEPITDNATVFYVTLVTCTRLADDEGLAIENKSTSCAQVRVRVTGYVMFNIIAYRFKKGKKENH